LSSWADAAAEAEGEEEEKEDGGIVAFPDTVSTGKLLGEEGKPAE